MRSALLIQTVIAAAAVAAVAAPLAAYANPALSDRNCFYSTQWRGWSAPAKDVLYLRVNNRDIYRVDLTPGPSGLRAPGAFLVNRIQGSNQICSALDLNLAVSDGHGFPTPLIARQLTKLTPSEIEALPPRSRP